MKIGTCERAAMCLDQGRDHAKVGDLVRTGSNALPVFRVIAIEGEKAWVRDATSGADYIIPLCRCRPAELSSA
jgi:hypothetical protein